LGGTLGVEDKRAPGKKAVNPATGLGKRWRQQRDAQLGQSARERTTRVREGKRVLTAGSTRKKENELSLKSF